MPFHAYVFFSDGRCAEAFDYYQEVFGGEVEIMRMGEAPEDERMPGADENTVMHASLRIGDALLMGSDDPTGDGGAKVGFSVSYSAPDAATATRIFEVLADSGEVTMPMEATFFSKAFGMVTDRVGVPWMIDTEEQP